VQLVQQLAPMVSELHSVQIPTGETVPESLQPGFFKSFIRDLYDTTVQRQTKRNTLPKHLMDQLPSYLPSFDEFMKFFKSDPLRLIHADLHLEHVFVKKNNVSLNVSGLIDMGDCRLAPASYEWISLHMITFQCKKNLLAQFFNDYGFSTAEVKQWAFKMMCITLVYEFDAMNTIASGFQIDLDKVNTLEELAEMLWNYKDLSKTAPMRQLTKSSAIPSVVLPPASAPIDIRPRTTTVPDSSLSPCFAHSGPSLRNSNSLVATHSPVHIRRN